MDDDDDNCQKDADALRRAADPVWGNPKASLTIPGDVGNLVDSNGNRNSRRPSNARSDSKGNSDRGSAGASLAPQSTKTGFGSNEELPFSTPKRKPVPKYKVFIRRVCRSVCESKAFILSGTLVTVWALSGDDLRLWVTNRPADPIFNGLVCFCIFFFSCEICVCCIGQNDYFMGFFFGLDVLSTITLVLDLTVVSDYLFNGSEGGDVDEARASRTARIGAKVGRVVRVLRLIRIVKLYKVFAGAEKRNHHREGNFNRGRSRVGEEFNLDDDADDNRKHLKESLVGKKLSAKTTQRTIMLVLTMLIILPIMTTDAGMRMPTSATLGADDIMEVFEEMRQHPGDDLKRRSYEDQLLKYVYYHNWFADSSCYSDNSVCSKWYYSQNFWVGIAGNTDMATLRSLANSSKVRHQVVEEFQQKSKTQNDLYRFGPMPTEVLQLLSSPWDTECEVSTIKHLGISLLAKEIPDKVGYAVKCPDDLRVTERELYTPRLLTKEQYVDWHFTFYFDLRPYTRNEAALNIFTTVFVCIVLCVASLFFSNDANMLVLQPVEQMITKVEIIRDNPLMAMKMADDEFANEEIARARSAAPPKCWAKFTNKIAWLFGYRKKNSCELMETAILEKTIIKLGSLLALGFGEAGANIVSHNMQGNASASVNAMIAGSRVECIVGNARIRDFSIATQVLQGKVMTFVNQIAEIVHGVVDEFHGAVNKNHGDTFLVIWRSADRPEEEVTKLAEMALMAFAMILGAIHRSPVLASYRFHPGLKQRLKDQCRVNLSFGLHCGWAIEGAVGSEFKIDASYLSPHVSLCTSLEHATKTYGVNIITSQAVADRCTKEMADHLRLIDRVIIKGSQEPTELYALDLDYMSLDVHEQGGHLVWNTHQRYRSRKLMEEEKMRLWSKRVIISDLFEDHQDIASMRARYTDEFLHLFNMGYQNYSQGEWLVARQLLTRTLGLLGTEDGPSAALLSFMETPYMFEAPNNWKGVHDMALEA